MKELVIISGKGGTGKTSIAASLACLAPSAVLADCDVDAADLHLVLAPDIRRQEAFCGGVRFEVEAQRCTACGRCAELCRFDAVHMDGPGNEVVSKTYRIDPIACEGCGVCQHFCPAAAIRSEPAVNGHWYESRTRAGPMVHARLGIGEENSGKLVSTVRAEARRLAEQDSLALVLIDGSPGVGCPVIASLAGADAAVIVTEPTLSGAHDFGRIADLAAHFGIATWVCVNKWDLNPEMTERIEAAAAERGIGLAGRVRYDRAVTDAQVRKQTVVEYTAGGAGEDVRQLWSAVRASCDLDSCVEQEESS